MASEIDSAPLQGRFSTKESSPQLSTSKEIPKKAKQAKQAKKVETA